jgi:hypothetical protein
MNSYKPMDLFLNKKIKNKIEYENINLALL